MYDFLVAEESFLGIGGAAEFCVTWQLEAMGVTKAYWTC